MIKGSDQYILEERMWSQYLNKGIKESIFQIKRPRKDYEEGATFQFQIQSNEIDFLDPF